MQLEILLGNKDTGKIWNISNRVESVKYTTNRTGTPGTLTMTVVKSSLFAISNGDVVRVSQNGQLIFYGWIFSSSRDRWGIIDVTCYDHLRYLKASASYAFYGQTAGQIIQQISADFQLPTGSIADTGYAIPSLIEEEQTCLDIINSAIQQTLLNTGKMYILYDDGDGIALAESGSMLSNILIGDASLLEDFKLKYDIDTQTYNSIKLARPNEETGRADVFIAQDSATIGEWGLLQLYQSIDEALNDAQAKAKAATMLEYYNREAKTITISSLGIPGLRAGQMAYIKISIGAPEFENGQYALLEKVTHNYENDLHTMEIETWPL